ncbi:hypothetical protein QQS21_002261 [Conoideocrella luteorostrata]|uniref:Uncharacterized protein n=1 Tax=Conoideocrella luteorostrata TaxID=1105319 RepID=A0AAJ0CVG6_9HYPO|nr:hypothetical protein QQS21_002261 [Conoideocrella luteorostrata]
MGCHGPYPDAQADFDVLSLREILDADSRPTFVLDLDPDVESIGSRDTIFKTIHPVFCNEALRLHERLYESVLGIDAAGLPSGNPTQAFLEFLEWSESVTAHDVSKDVFPVAFLYNNVLWTGSTVRHRWRLVSGNQAWRKQDIDSLAPPITCQDTNPMADEPLDGPKQDVTANSGIIGSVNTQSDISQPTLTSYIPSMTGSNSDETGLSSYSSSILLTSPEMAVTDWTVPKPKGLLSPHLKYARSVEWAKTPLGPMDDWSPEFRQVANLCMSNPHPAALFWGSELTMLYNEAYAAEVAGNKHPALMGTGFSGPFAELWDYAGPIFAECARTGTSVRKDRDYLPINRKGIVEETFYSWSFTPLYGGTTRILGFYNAPFETTQEVVGQRRMQTVNQLGERTSQAKTVKKFWACVLESLDDNHYDVPFALLYSVGESEDTDDTSMSSGSTVSPRCCHLEGALGVPDGHPASPPQLDLKRSLEGFVPSFRKAMRTREPTVLNTRDGTLPEDLLRDFQWRGFGDPCRQAIIFPVRPTNGDNVLAFLVLGVAPHRIYDSEYEAFVRMLNRQLATSLASVILYESEVHRSRDAAEAAALEQEHLKQELNLQASRMRRMTELSLLGMFLISPDGVLLEANEQFYEMTGHLRESQYELSWMDFIAETSMGVIRHAWTRMHDEQVSWSGELQLKKRHPESDLREEVMDHWALFTGHVELNGDGSLRSIMASITDISHLKWAQGLQNRRLQEAEEMRRRQNEFIDITSHEMRNPLSAILQCADDILASLGEYNKKVASPPTEVVTSCLEAASTISLCVQHQKAIVDDVLTISKLDSNLLVITPVAAQPAAVLKRAVKMFEPELQANDFRVVLESNPVHGEVKTDWVMLDPGRVLQILINLISNAIKFTTPSANRTITIATTASVDPPTESYVAGFRFASSETAGTQITNSRDWGRGELLYVCFKVQDTGCGLSPEEQQILFQRFKQASPRTHAIYGGSGLGLFISRRLTELHGGQIGVASTAGQGSVFVFYVQARRCDSLPSSMDTTGPLHIQPPAKPINRSLDQCVTPGHQDSPHPQVLGSDFGVPSPTLSEFDLEHINILVVEDNLINQKVLVKQLKKLGCQVNAANDGLEALAFLKKTHFYIESGLNLSVILMDLEMPNMDGLTCVREIRAMQGRREIASHVPVIAVTANVRDQQIMDAKAAGMDDVVSKPFSIPDLLKKMTALLQLRYE